jgi:ubiquinone biosynthesis protein
MLRQIFVHGYFHADPHPGNVHILPGNVVCFLDFGLTGFLVRAQRETLAALLAAIALQDEGAATAALLKLAGAELEPPSPGLEADVADFTHRHFTGPAREMVFTRLLRHFFQLTARHSLTLPPEIFIVLKSLGQVEQVIHELAPDYDLMEEAKPFIGDLYASRLRPRWLRRELVAFVGDAMSTLRVLPLELRRIAAQLRGGKSKVTFKVEGLSPLTETLERVTNRLAFAVVLAALIMASALIIHSGLAPTWHGVSVIGLVGYVFAGLMGGALLLAILRHGRM